MHSDTVIVIDTLPGDPYPVEIIKEVPVPYKVLYPDSIFIDTLRKRLLQSDSLLNAYLNNCEAHRSYFDTFIIADSLAKINLSYAVQNNILTDRTFHYQRLRGDIVKTVTITQKPKDEIWIDLAAGYKTLQIGACYHLRGGYSLGIGFDLAQKTPVVRTGVRLFSKD